MQFGVLGPLQVIAGDPGEPDTVLAARLRVLLAALLWRAGQPVPKDELAELVWDGAPPRGAADATRALVMRLRRRLDARAAARIVTHAHGYVIEASGDELDASLFETLTKETGIAVGIGRWAQAGRTAAEALRLWRGTPLVDVPSQLMRDSWLPHLEQLHVQALEWQAEAGLNEGRHEQLIPQLRDLTARHPLREHFHGQFMLALYRCGRQAEAIAAYQRVRRVLIDELGIEPGPALRRLHERVLVGDTGLLAAPAPRPGPPPASTPQRADASAVPRQLPAGVRHFVGRAVELTALSELVTQQLGSGGAAVVTAIGGTAGIGKTALAVHWAHQVADRFPDGQLYVNLRGFDPTGAPVPTRPTRCAASSTRSACRAERIPAEPGRAGRAVPQPAGRPADADRAGQRPRRRPGAAAAAGAPDCLVLVTSRNQLTGLVALHGACRSPLTCSPARRPATCWSAAWAANGSPPSRAGGRELIAGCARLPLALTIAAAPAALPGRPLSAAGRRAQRRPPPPGRARRAGRRADVRTVFSWSYHALDHEPARVFRLLGLHSGPDISLEATASLAALDLDSAGRALRHADGRSPGQRARPRPLHLPRPAARLRGRTSPHP